MMSSLLVFSDCQTVKCVQELGSTQRTKRQKKSITLELEILLIAEYLLSKAVRTKESRQLMFRMLPLHCPHSHCLAGEYHIQ